MLTELIETVDDNWKGVAVFHVRPAMACISSLSGALYHKGSLGHISRPLSTGSPQY